MTTMPVEPTLPQTISLSSVDELRTQAQRLGLTWNLRAATVAETAGAFTAYVPRIDLDGDDSDSAGITAVSFIGGLAVGMRVMVVFVPPTGYYIVGVFDPAQTRHYEFGAHSTHGTTITTTETILETFPSFAALSGAAYRWVVFGSLVAAVGVYTQFKIRKTNTAGQILAASGWFDGQAIIPPNVFHQSYFRNVGTSAVISNIVLTAATTSSTSTWYADAGIARGVSIRYDGPAVEYPSATGIL